MTMPLRLRQAAANGLSRRSRIAFSSSSISSSSLGTPSQLASRFLSSARRALPAAYEDHQAIERKWQAAWQASASGPTPSNSTGKQAKYILSMFPYPSGTLHLGHVRVYTISDTLARFNRMQGVPVLHPMGWDAFGLPAENAAMERGVSADEWTRKNIDNMRSQLASLGLSFDWERELSTAHPEYFRWTQWLFLRLYRAGLCYRAEAEVNWDPVDKTVLANEQVDALGKSWRSGALVEKRMLEQWFVRTTAFAGDLLRGLHIEPLVDQWPLSVRTMQAQWIGESHGAHIDFALDGSNGPLTVFTTRPETLLGATFLAVAPGRAPGSRTARHPLTGRSLPVLEADYVVAEYGQGAVMGVPAHDERDAAFAAAHGLPVVRVIDDEGRLCNSGASFDGLEAATTGREAIVRALAARGAGKAATTYRLHDWLVSRQRRWGAPVPMIHCASCGPQAVPEDHLPVPLPPRQVTEQDVGDWEQGRLAERDPTMDTWLECSCPTCESRAHRDPDSLDTFVDSSWYYLRFCDPHSKDEPFSTAAMEKWIGNTAVDVYVGGIEHAILHLLYARFVFKFLRSEGLLGSRAPHEPFRRLIAQGMVLGLTAKDAESGRYLKHGVEWELADNERAVRIGSDGGDGPIELVWEKMSKSKHNGVNPDDVVRSHGADATRLATLFAGPPDRAIEWSGGSLEGQVRFLRRVWATVVATAVPEGSATPTGARTDSAELRIGTLRAIENVTAALQEDKAAFNVAVAELMKLVNLLAEFDPSLEVSRWSASVLVRMLAPMAPHVTEELWTGLELGASVHDTAWPRAEEAPALDSSQSSGTDDGEHNVIVVCQVNGKFRGRVVAPKAVIEPLLHTARDGGAGNLGAFPGPVGECIDRFLVSPVRRLVLKPKRRRSALDEEEFVLNVVLEKENN